MSERAKAWILDIGEPFLLAISELEMVEVLETPESYPVLHGPDYCNRVIVRHNEVMPLVDLSLVDGHEVPGGGEETTYTVVLAYQVARDAMVSRAGLLVRRAPKGITVGNEMEMLPPSGLPDRWQELMIACFEWNRNPVVVADLGRLLVPDHAA